MRLTLSDRRGETLGTKIGEITSGEIPRGEEVEIEGKIREVLPTVRLGQEMYERLIVEDDTGTVTVVVKVTPFYFFPGDVIRVKGVVKPCFYMTQAACVEADPDGIEFVKEYRIPLTQREILSKLGPFKLMSLLMFSRLDAELIDLIIDTRLDPLKLAREAEQPKRLERIVELLSGMTFYSVFVRDVGAAKVTETALLLIKGKVTEPKLLGKLELMEYFLRAIVEEQGFRYAIEPVPMPPIQEVDTRISEEEAKQVHSIVETLSSAIAKLRGGSGPGLVLIDLPDEDPLKGRALAKLVASKAHAKLYVVNVDAIRTNFETVVMELTSLASTLTGPAVVYIEGVEYLIPTDLIKLTMDAESGSAFDTLATKVTETLKKLSSRPNVLVLAGTISPAVVSSRLLSAAELKVAMKEEARAEEEEGEMPSYVG